MTNDSNQPRSLPVELTTEEHAFKTELLGAAERLDRPPNDLAARIAARLPPPKQVHRAWGNKVPILALAAVGMVVCLGVGVWLGDSNAKRAAGSGTGSMSVQPEPVFRVAFAGAAASATALALGPCAQRYRAAGLAPLIDDFEDGDSTPLPSEGRFRDWFLFFDYDREGQVARTLVPETAPGREGGQALHLAGKKLQDWGAVLELSFAPYFCYDASAYGGVTFRARGPARLSVGVRENRVVPTKWGGTCEKDCYNAHVEVVELTDRWQRYKLPWSVLRQRGYDMPPLDPATLHSIQFLVHAEDTPFDFWLDDVAFLPRPGGK
ncbi:MAG: hypothetical protein JW751_18445 [Polyangiaceae bacterium]|nr:hypothetical protein [Polyangiaceae bacterium]